MRKLNITFEESFEQIVIKLRLIQIKNDHEVNYMPRGHFCYIVVYLAMLCLWTVYKSIHPTGQTSWHLPHPVHLS